MKKLTSLIVFMVAFMNIVWAQQVEIRGTIVDANTNEPLPGATIMEKGTTNGTVSDVKGNFVLKTLSSSGYITVTFVGYLGQEFQFNGSTSINIQLKPDVAGIEEVVVIGYGTQKKSHLTGSISKVTNEGMDQIPVSRADQALIGKVSGVNIQTTDATAGASPTIRVRGIGSITADASPLIVVDGVVVDNDYLGSLDMNDVESFEILKDAASAAIYGSRGGNGIIMISTKQGKEGQTKFSFNGFAGPKFTADFDYRPSISEWKQFVLDNNGGVLTDRMAYIEKLGTETDWQDVMFDGGTIQNYSLSARGGSKKTKYFISGSYLSDDGVLLTDSYNKMSARLKIDTKVNKIIEFGANVSPSQTYKRDFPIGVHDALRQSPWLPIWHDENTIQYVDRSKYPDVQIGDYAMERHFDNYDLYNDGGDTDISTTSNVNPYAKVVERKYTVKDFKLLSNAYLRFHLLDGLTFTSRVAANYRHRQDEEWVGSKAHRNGTSAMESNYDTDTYTYWLSENMFSYNKTFGKHDISAVAGMTWEKWNTVSEDMEGTGYQFDYIQTINAATVIANAATYKSEESLHSIISRFNYAYDSKYLFSLSARYDGSSRFGKDTKYGFFPAASVGWRISEEEFLKNNDLISNLKVRVSYGVTGNNSGIGRYDAISKLSAVTAIVNGNAVTGFNQINIANNDLRWEKSVEFTPGIDIGFMKNRWNFTIDYYVRRSNDLLLSQEIPSVTGFTSATVNIGEVKNSGFEFEFLGRVFSQKDFSWTTSFNLSHNKNELVDFAGASGLITYVDAKRPAEYIALEGYPISSFYGYVYEKDIPNEYLKNPFYPIGGKSQDVYVKDLNGDGEIDSDDRAILGSPYPKWVWGFTNTFRYKGFDFSFTLQGSHGAKVRNLDPQYFENQFASNMDYVDTFPDKDKVVQRIFTDLCVQDASFIALRSINLGYTLPKALAQKLGIGSARIYVSGSNLIYLMADSYTSFNPEGVTNDDSPLRGGYQVGAAPYAKAMTVGLNLEF
ncbi:SusC/RagA family TonB-linked outer membrane protein [Tenuifilum thalassicum]|uniref:TonB-dependent receptor n=1 Tax=Tenuifilum thalassicum TaxID=2590900 RepID=A0A7D4BAK9_9BACT|nr:TonB-dependent receptor [Tenuifilum thalassicum]QKG79460.1 TonB-dependent receptor [Tenuifilum thalassicum]